MQSTLSLRMNKAGGVIKPTGQRVAAPRISTPRMIVRVQAEKGALGKFSDSIGMPTDDGVFGFTPFAEQWVGRWAMLGFASSVVGEFVTGKGALGQLGVDTPSTEIFAAILILSFGGSIVGSVVTGKKVLDNSMTKAEIVRYKNFLRLNNQTDAEAGKAKNEEVFTSMDANAGNADAGSTTEPVAAATSTPSTSAQTEMYPGEANDTAFAEIVEITNGRYAMIGFLASILVEAATGNGILGQIIMYLKLSGALGDRSGF